MTFDWEQLGTLIGGAAITVVTIVFAMGKGAALFSKDLTTIKTGKDERWLYQTLKNELNESIAEIKQLKEDHQFCKDRIEEQGQLLIQQEAKIRQLTIQILDLQNRLN